MTAPTEQTASSSSGTTEAPVSTPESPVIGPLDPVTRVEAPTESRTDTIEPPEASRGPSPRSGGSDGGGPGKRRHWFWKFGFPSALVLLIIAIPVLVYAGSRVVLASHGGKIVATVTDPAAPGWEAVVDATPTMAVANLDAKGGLDSVTILSLTGDANGGVVQVPASTLVDLAGIGKLPLSIVYEKSGIDGVQHALEGIIGSGIDETEVVDAARWASLTKPVGPLVVSNPDPVTETNGFGQPEVVFPKGSIDIPAEQVSTYLSTKSPGENELSRSIRHEAFWRAWLAQVGSSSNPDQAVPGEVESGLGRFVRGLARDQVDFSTLPVNREVVPGTFSEVYEPQTGPIRQLFSRLVPFPNGPEGTRVRLRVLDGTGQLDHGVSAAVALAAAGGQIDKVGNAERFDVETTQLIYTDDSLEPRMQKLRDALGFGELVKSEAINAAVDATIILGSDAIGSDVGTVQSNGGGSGG